MIRFVDDIMCLSRSATVRLIDGQQNMVNVTHFLEISKKLLL